MNNFAENYPFIPPPEMPVNITERQILFDFNDGARLFFREGDCRVQVSDELKERIAFLEHADFFIGRGSGLSWLAWACHIPVIMISGFSLPFCEFTPPCRVIKTHVCHGCWDDLTVDFDHHDFLWCPRHKGTLFQYECTRFITGKQVIHAVVRVIKDNNEKLQHPSNFIKENVESS